LRSTHDTHITVSTQGVSRAPSQGSVKLLTSSATFSSPSVLFVVLGATLAAVAATKERSQTERTPLLLFRASFGLLTIFEPCVFGIEPRICREEYRRRHPKG